MSFLPPNAGHGLHEFVLEYTRKELAKGRSEETVRASTWRLCRDKGRRESILRREIDDAIAGAIGWLGEHPEAFSSLSAQGEGSRSLSFDWWNARLSGGLKHPPQANRWALPVDQGMIKRVLGRIRRLNLEPLEKDLFDLWTLYGEINFPVCLADKVHRPISMYLSDWERGRRWKWNQWMVPNPCHRCGVGGGVKSYANAGERIWLVVEFDHLGLEDQAKLLVWLGKLWPLSLGLIVYSGGKSLHGWFSCVGKSERWEICKFFKTATRLGCDRAMQSSVQYTRMPSGVNAKTQKEQEIWHYDLEVIAEHKKKLVEAYER